MNRSKGALSAMFLAVAALTAGSMILPTAAVARTDSYDFLKAVRAGDGTKVEAMLGDQPLLIINTKDDVTGEAALHIVVNDGDPVWTGYMLAHGANPDAIDKNRVTPLMLAATKGFDEGIEKLIAFKADVNMANRKGETALILAVKFRRNSAAALLLRAGANADKADYSGYSAREYAAQYGKGNNLLALIESGGKTDADKSKGDTTGLDFSGIGDKF